MKKISKLLVLLILFLTLSVVSCSKIDLAKNTKDYVVSIIEKKGADNITWEDFEYLEHEDVGSGILVNVYKLKDSYRLTMGGLGEKIEYIYTTTPEGKEIYYKEWSK